MTESKPNPPHREAPLGTTRAAARPRRLKRRLLWALVVLLIVGVVLRIALWLTLPSLIERTAAQYGLECDYERLDLSLLAGDLELWHCVLRPAAGGEPYLDTEYVRGDLDVLELLRGQLSVRRLEVDGMDITIERAADGSLPVLEHFMTEVAEADAESTAAEEDAAIDADLDLSAPLMVSALRLQHVRVLWRDLSVTPPVEDRLEANVRLSSLGSASRSTRFALSLASTTPDSVIDVLRVEGEGRSAESSLDAQLSFAVRGLHPVRARRYLTLAGLEAGSDTVSLTAKAELSASRIEPDEGASAAGPRRAVQAEATLSDVAVRVDGSDAVRLGRLRIQAASLGNDEIHIQDVLVEEGAVEIERHADGNIQVAGLIVPAQARAAGPSATSTRTRSTATANRTDDNAVSSTFRLDNLRLRELAAHWKDAAVSPAAHVEVRLEEAVVKNIVHDPSREPTPALIEARCALPGVAEQIALDGMVVLEDGVASFQSTLSSSGVALTALRPYLLKANADTALVEGHLSTRLSGTLRLATAQERTRVTAQLEDLVFKDRSPLFQLRSLAVRDLLLPSGDEPGLRVGALECRGIRASAKRHADGAIEVAGLRLGGSRESATAALPEADVTSLPRQATGRVDEASLAPLASRPAEDFAFPDFALEMLRVEETEFVFEDAFVEPMAAIRVADAGLELKDLQLGAGGRETASVRAWLEAPGTIESLVAQGTITTTPTDAKLAAVVTGTGIQTGEIAPYLAAQGLEPALDNGSLSVKLEAGVTPKDHQVSASLALSELVYEDGDEELFALTALRTGIVLDSEGLVVDAVVIDQPRVSARRDSGGSFSLLGITIPGASSHPQKPEASESVAEEEAEEEPRVEDRPFQLAVHALHLAGGRLFLSDAAQADGETLEARLDLRVGGVTPTAQGSTTPIHLVLQVPGAVEKLTLNGQLEAGLRRQRAEFALIARGLRGGPLDSYLPSGLRISLENGELEAKLSASASQREDGSLRAEARIEDLALRERHGEPKLLLGFASLRAALGHLAPDGLRIEIEEVALDELETEIRVTEDATYLPGLALVAPETADPEGPESPAEEATTNPSESRPATRTESAPAPPLVLLESLALHVKRCDVYVDGGDSSAVPLRLAEVRLANRAPFRMLGEDAETLPPAELRLRGTAQPVVGEFQVDTRLQPFASEPNVTVQLDASAVQGGGLTAVIPRLASTLASAGLENGKASATLDVHLLQKRRRSWELDFQKPFGIDASLRDVALHGTPDGPILAGFELLRMEVASVRPATGEVHLRALELGQIRGHVRQTPDGIEALGLLFKTPSKTSPSSDTEEEGEEVGTETRAESDADTAGTTEPPEAVVDAAAPSAGAEIGTAPQPAPETTGEVRIDRLLVSGIDFTFEDQTVDPPSRIPLDELELEVTDLSTHAFTQSRPVRFDLLLSAGKVPLPKLERGDAVTRGIGEVGDLLGGGNADGSEEQPPREERPLVQEINASGRLSFHPQLTGWGKLDVNALELTAFQGQAAAAGITLEQGALDSAVQLRFAKDGGMSSHSTFRFTDLSVSEPPDGPISRYLLLPGPLDTVLFVLRDENGAIEVPIHFELEPEGVSTLGIAQTAITTFGSLVASSIAASPLRLAGTVTDLVPGVSIPGVGAEAPAVAESFAIQFAPGDVALDLSARRQLDAVLEKLYGDDSLVVTLRHHFGRADLPLIRERANPPAAECESLARALRGRRRDLTRERARVAASTRAAFGARLEEEAAAGQRRLREIETQIGRTEEALDSVLERLRPGAERQSSRRTRQTAVVVGQLRVRALRDYLLQSVIEAGLEQPLERLRLIKTRFEENTSIDGGGQVEARLSVRRGL